MADESRHLCKSRSATLIRRVATHTVFMLPYNILPFLAVPAGIENSDIVSDPNVIIDKSITLSCPATGIPIPDVTWYKENRPILRNTTKVFILDNGWRLLIDGAEVKHTGRYSCRATNKAGKTEKFYDLDVFGEFSF